MSPAELVSNDDDTTIIRGKLDDRRYRRMRLDNGLEVLLISDPDTPKAAAAMDVGVGYFHDPENVAGLAHFLEHMLFLGSQKYPTENAFESFIQNHGGSNNAYTSMENTNFFFDILPADLEGGLDRFAQFFVSPTLAVEGAQREMNAVNSEHRKNIESDGWRSTQIKRHVASKDTPYSKFGTGSIETLGKHSEQALRQHLVDLWTKYYTAGNMRLVVLGGHSLSQLARFVQDSFEYVRPTPPEGPRIARDIKFEDKSEAVYDRNMKKTTVFYTPVRRLRTLTLQWAIPSQAARYRTNGGSYLAHLIEADGPGTLHSQLRKKGWITAINAGVGVTATSFSLFQIELIVTPRGQAYMKEIAEAVFQTLNRINKRGLSRWRYNEMAQLARVQFAWKGKERPQTLVSDIASRMRWFRQEHWISGNSLFYSFDKDSIRDILNRLTPDNVVIFQSSRSLSKTMALNQTEPHYKIKYTSAPVPAETIDIWRTDAQRSYLFGEPRRSNKLKLPEPNKWIPTPKGLAVKPYYDMRNNTFVTKVNVNSTVHIAAPMVIYEAQRPAARVWFRQDAKFHRPIVHANIRLWSAGIEASPRAAVTSLMYIQLVNDLLQDWAFAPSNAGYEYALRPDREGVTLTVVGYTENLESYFKSIAFRLSEGFRPRLDRFLVLRERALEALANSKYAAPYKYARSLMRLALGESHPVSELANALNTITLEDVKAWPGMFLGDARMEVFFNGNIFPWEARSFAKAARKVLGYKTLSTTFTDAHRQIQLWKSRRPLLDGRYTLTTPSLDKNEPNSMVYALFQAGPGKDVDRLYMQLLDRYLHKPAYNALRTQEQLGYIVWTIGATTADVQELAIQVQSTNHSPQYVNARIQTFLANFRENLHAKIDAATFAKHVMTMYESKLVNSTTLMEDTKTFWGAIVSQRYNFLQRFVDAQLLIKEITLGGFMKFVDRTLGYGKYSGSSLTLEVFANGKNETNIPAAPTQFRAHTKLPNPMPANEYTDRLRQIASANIAESLNREGKLSDYLRKDRAFRRSDAGRKILNELLQRRAQRAILKRNVLQHLEHRSMRQLKKSHGYNAHHANCTKKCEKVQVGQKRDICVSACVTRKMNVDNEKAIIKNSEKCVDRCNVQARTMGVNQNATVLPACIQTCRDIARQELEQGKNAAKKAEIARKQIAEERKRRREETQNGTRPTSYTEEEEQRNVNSTANVNATSDAVAVNGTQPVLNSAETAGATNPAASMMEAEAYYNAIHEVRQVVDDHNNPEAVRAAAYAARDLRARLEDVSFLESEVEISEQSEAEAEAESDIETMAEFESAEAAESFADSLVESGSAAEAQAARDLEDKAALLDALEQEAFRAGLEARAAAEREVAALAETGVAAKDVPSTMYSEEGDKSWKRSGYDKFERISDPREEMESFGRPKQDVRGIQDRVALRYANITASESFFQYDGQDTDAPITMTIAYSPSATKTRQLTVATLSSLRHTLFLAPLRVKENVPLLVPVPRAYPEGIPTIPESM